MREAFGENFARRGEVGAAVAVTVDRKPVVDLQAGYGHAARTRPWTRDTIVNVASATKGPTAICAHHLADRGLLDLDAPVGAYWPEFAGAGKGAIPVHMLLSHRAGLPAIETPLPTEAPYDWDTMTGVLAAQAPWWESGTRHGYQAFTFGWLVGEVVRRITGKSLGSYWRDEVAQPLGIDCHSCPAYISQPPAASGLGCGSQPLASLSVRQRAASSPCSPSWPWLSARLPEPGAAPSPGSRASRTVVSPGPGPRLARRGHRSANLPELSQQHR